MIKLPTHAFSLSQVLPEYILWPGSVLGTGERAVRKTDKHVFKALPLYHRQITTNYRINLLFVQ